MTLSPKLPPPIAAVVELLARVKARCTVARVHGMNVRTTSVFRDARPGGPSEMNRALSDSDLLGNERLLLDADLFHA
jgi:hypothetical protein